MQPEPLSSLARRERQKASEPKTAELFALPPRLEPETKALAPIVVDVKRGPRIVFLEVERDDAGELVGLRPIYEDQRSS